MMEMTQRTVTPENLDSHPLFSGSAEFAQTSFSLAVADIDSHLRRLRNMPSTSDATAARILSGASALHRLGMKWIGDAMSGDSSGLGALMSSVGRARASVARGLPEPAVIRLVQRLVEVLPSDIRDLAAGGHGRGESPAETLAMIELALVDRILRQNNTMRRRYLKRAYRAVDAGLQFNSTTDLVRLEPVLAWIREQLQAEWRRDLSYVDVGCAATAGAPAVCLAAKRLRPGGLVRSVHGVDVAAPSPILARELVKVHRVVIYGADPVRRALPRPYDVILLANVHRHLTLELQSALFGHLRDSLTEGGWLFVNWRFDDRTSPCLCLRRRSSGLVPMAEHNCV